MLDRELEIEEVALRRWCLSGGYDLVCVCVFFFQAEDGIRDF